MVQRQDSVVVVGQLETCCTFLSPLAGWNSSFEDKKGNVLASGAWDVPREARHAGRQLPNATGPKQKQL